MKAAEHRVCGRVGGLQLRVGRVATRRVQLAVQFDESTRRPYGEVIFRDAQARLVRRVPVRTLFHLYAQMPSLDEVIAAEASPTIRPGPSLAG